MGARNSSEKKTDRELATARRAMALATQDPSPIFELNVDCWEEIFDWLSVDDVHAFGQTCKFFHRIAGKYFEWKYKKISFLVYKNRMNVNGKNFEEFNEFAQRLFIYDPEPDTSLLYASANCKSPIELQIKSVYRCYLNLNRLEKMLASVEILTFEDLHISDKFMESILKLCATNLKRLAIDKTTRCDWMHHKYPKLQHLRFYEVNSPQELVKFLEGNPNVRSFLTVAENILKYQSEFMASDIELDDLTVLRSTEDNAVSTALIALYSRGFYKRLHFTTYTKNHLADLPGLTSLHIGTHDNIDLPRLPTVTRMSCRSLCERSRLNMDEVTNALVNLERVLMHGTTSMLFIMPFIRNSKKLKVIKTHFFHNDHNGDIDPVLMNSEREKLNATHKVMIYVEEEDYLRIKWKYGRSDFGLIEMKRSDSNDGV